MVNFLRRVRQKGNDFVERQRGAVSESGHDRLAIFQINFLIWYHCG